MWLDMHVVTHLCSITPAMSDKHNLFGIHWSRVNTAKLGIEATAGGKCCLYCIRSNFKHISCMDKVGGAYVHAS